jgi:hypothetical protein
VGVWADRFGSVKCHGMVMGLSGVCHKHWLQWEVINTECGMTMNRWYKGTLVLLSLYALYLVKSAVGINILPNHSLWWPFKLPIQGIMEARYGAPLH